MGFIDSVFQGVAAAKGNKKDDYGYNVLENSPMLHSSSMLKDMAKGATKEQKASIYKHMVDHEVVDPDYKGYYDLSRDLWDDFSK